MEMFCGFQIKSHVSGYLYVVDKGTTGETNTLFPGANAIPGDNHIVDGKTYTEIKPAQRTDLFVAKVKNVRRFATIGLVA
jgi:Domain of unknown function (DUF4384)